MNVKFEPHCSPCHMYKDRADSVDTIRTAWITPAHMDFDEDCAEPYFDIDWKCSLGLTCYNRGCSFAKASLV